MDVRLTVMINPNNPTGDFLPFDEAIRFVDQYVPDNSYLIVDESMLFWQGPDWKSHSFSNHKEATDRLLRRNVRVVIIQSWTKIFNCCGLRVGSLLTNDPALYSELKTNQPPWSLNAIAREYLLHCYRTPEYLESTWNQIRRWRAEMVSTLSQISEDWGAGWTFEGADFVSWIWINTHDSRLAHLLTHESQSSGYPIRHGIHGYMKDSYIRVAVACPSEIQEWYDVIRRCLSDSIISNSINSDSINCSDDRTPVGDTAAADTAADNEIEEVSEREDPFVGDDGLSDGSLSDGSATEAATEAATDAATEAATEAATYVSEKRKTLLRILESVGSMTVQQLETFKTTLVGEALNGMFVFGKSLDCSDPETASDQMMTDQMISEPVAAATDTVNLFGASSDYYEIDQSADQSAEHPAPDTDSSGCVDESVANNGDVATETATVTATATATATAEDPMESLRRMVDTLYGYVDNEQLGLDDAQKESLISYLNQVRWQMNDPNCIPERMIDELNRFCEEHF